MSNNRSTKLILTAMDKHVKRFVNEDWSYDPKSVAKGLEDVHADYPLVKGVAISTFNASHVSKCPAMSGSFVPDEKTGYAKFLHMGTTRIWNEDGSVDEAKWKEFE